MDPRWYAKMMMMMMMDRYARRGLTRDEVETLQWHG